MTPTKPLHRLASVANEFIDLGRAEIAGIDSNEIFARASVDPFFRNTLAFPNNASADFCKSKFDKFTHRV